VVVGENFFLAWVSVPSLWLEKKRRVAKVGELLKRRS